jgi:hypothetical protein
MYQVLNILNSENKKKPIYISKSGEAEPLQQKTR